MSTMSRLDEQLQNAQSGIKVEDITGLVEFYRANMSVNPITNDAYSYEAIVQIMCKTPERHWDDWKQHWYNTMEILLLKDIISDMRLDAIQYQNALNDIESVVTTKSMQADKPSTVHLQDLSTLHSTTKQLQTIAAIVKLARNMGV